MVRPSIISPTAINVIVSSGFTLGLGVNIGMDVLNVVVAREIVGDGDVVDVWVSFGVWGWMG